MPMAEKRKVPILRLSSVAAVATVLVLIAPALLAPPRAAAAPLTPSQQIINTQLRLYQNAGLGQYGTASVSGGGLPGWIAEKIGQLTYKTLDVATDLVTVPFVTIAGGIFSLAVTLALLPIWNTTFVQLGSAITLGVANMFFVLILLWIAIATIFDFEPYTARRLLLRLIIAALLINFSVAIGSSFIRLSNAMADIFYKQIGGSAIGIGGEFIKLSKFAPVKDATPGNPKTGHPPGVLAGLLGYLVPPSGKDFSFTAGLQAIIGKLAITPVLIFVLLAGAFFLLVRQIALAFVLVLAPLAFLFMILPHTQRFTNDWWGALTKWAFFFPAFMFFLFLSLKSGGGLLSAYTGNQQDPVLLLFQYFLVIGLMLGSLIVSHQMGVYGSSAIINWGKRSAAAAGRWAGSRLLLQATAPIAKRVEESQSRAARALMKVPFVRRGLQSYTALEREEAKRVKSQLEKFSSSELQRRSRGFGATQADRIAIADILMERRDLAPEKTPTGQWKNNWTPDMVKNTIAYQRSIGRDVIGLERAVPHLAKDTRATVAGMRAEHIDRMDPAALDNVEVLKAIAENWKSGQYSRMMSFSPVMVKKFQTAVEGRHPDLAPGEAQALAEEMIAAIRRDPGTRQYFQASAGQGFGYAVPGVTGVTTEVTPRVRTLPSAGGETQEEFEARQRMRQHLGRQKP